MFLKTCLFILFLCLFTHACVARTISATSHNKLHPHKEKLKLSMRNRGDVGDTVSGYRIPRKSTAVISEKNEDLCKKIRPTTKGTKSGSENCESSLLHKEVLHPPKSQVSKWPHLNKDMGIDSLIFRECLSETDYQPPQRKSPIHN